VLRVKSPISPGNYPTEDDLNFAGIDFPMPISEIVKLEGQNPNLAINVFGWEKDHIIVISKIDGAHPGINLKIIHPSCMTKAIILTENIFVNHAYKDIRGLICLKGTNQNAKAS